MSNDKVDSHIQMSKCLLKRFEDKSHRFCYYDVDKKMCFAAGLVSCLEVVL